MNTLTTREMVALYGAGNSPAKIAKQCTIGHAGVRSRLKKEGVVFRKKGHNPVEADYLAGLNLRQIAKKHSVSHETVRQRLKARGVQLRDTNGRERTTPKTPKPKSSKPWVLDIGNAKSYTTFNVEIPEQHTDMFNTLFSAFGAKQV